MMGSFLTMRTALLAHLTLGSCLLVILSLCNDRGLASCSVKLSFTWAWKSGELDYKSVNVSSTGQEHGQITLWKNVKTAKVRLSK